MHHYEHQIQFYETDLMGVVHHSNYLRVCEEARVHWAHRQGFIDYQHPQSAAYFAVLETQVRHLRTCSFGDILHIDLEVKVTGARIFFQYRLKNSKTQEVVAIVNTVHVSLSTDLKPVRIPKAMRKKLEEEKWTETWL